MGGPAARDQRVHQPGEIIALIHTLERVRIVASNKSKVKVGVVGCGHISTRYFSNMCNTFDCLDVVAAADLNPDRAAALAGEFAGVKAMTVEQLLADSEIDIVVNLTIPAAHGEVALAAIEAGKSVYNEKPLAVACEDSRRILDAARAKGVLVGGAPDTFLGGGIQTCRKLIDDGAIGEPVAATAFYVSHGHEAWHPDPEFYYKVGGGPMFDMGPYYLTAMVNLMGPIRRVTGSARVTYGKRLITSQPKNGTEITVDVPTHIAGVLDFSAGAIATIVTSFDVWAANVPCIEIYGSAGTLSVPDPDYFGGTVRLRRQGEKDWTDVPLSHGYTDDSRGLGVADMARGLLTGRPHRASGELANHVLEVMHAIHQASDTDSHVSIESQCDRPAALPVGLTDGQLD